MAAANTSSGCDMIPMNGADDVVNGQKVSQAYALRPHYLNTGQRGTGL